MIERIKTVTWEVRSHRLSTVLTDKGILLIKGLPVLYNKADVKKMIWHLEDVLKCMNQIEKEKEKKEAYEKSIKDLGELLDERKEKGG